MERGRTKRLVVENFHENSNFELEFDLTVQLEDCRFLVAINGLHYSEYSHNMTTRNVLDTLSIMGDLQNLAISFS